MYSERGDTRILLRCGRPPGAPCAPRGLVEALAGELFGRLLEQRPLLAGYGSPKPGHTQFTRIPSAAWASARLLVMLTTAALLALYGRLHIAG